MLTSIMKKPLLLLGLVIATGHLRAADELPLDSYHGEGDTVPAGATVSLRLPLSVMIGEQIPAALLVGNAGTEPFEITTGGDYRSTGYPQRMKVRVQDADGRLLPELSRESYGGGGGGFVQSKSIAPGGSVTIEFPLDCYVNFPRAGTYFVTAGHDLGWKIEKDHRHPLGQASLVVTAPTDPQAAALVEKILASQPDTPPADESDRLSRESELKRQLCILRHPVYLPPLAKAAQAGSRAAVMGIGNIAGPAATETLIALLDHTSPEIIATSASQILKRLPSRQDPANPAHSNNWPNLYLVDPLLPSSWEPEFEKPLMDAALKLLSTDNREVLEMAGCLIGLRGEPKDAPAILAVLRKSLDVYQSPRRGENAGALDPPMPQGALISALDALRKRGWRTDGTGGMAELLAWFRQIADPTIPPPAGDGWKDSMLTWIENGPSTLRICALQAVPKPMPDTHVAAVLKALEDPDLGVARVACEVAGASQRPVFAKPLV